VSHFILKAFSNRVLSSPFISRGDGKALESGKLSIHLLAKN
jgi:hypothetical protein